MDPTLVEGLKALAYILSTALLSVLGISKAMNARLQTIARRLQKVERKLGINDTGPISLLPFNGNHNGE